MKIYVIFILLIAFSCKEKGGEIVQPEIVLEREKPQPNHEEVKDFLQINKPEKNSVIKSPLVIEGEARGYWFFEGIAPVEIMDSRGEVLKNGSIEAKENWMTEDFVPFTASINFEPSGAEKGYVVFRKANPSGLPEKEYVVKIPVGFQP